MDNRRKIIVALLIVLTIVVGIGAIIASQLIQNNLTPSGSSADTSNQILTFATSSMASDFTDLTINSTCSGLLSQQMSNYYSIDTFSIIEDNSIVIDKGSLINTETLNCEFTVKNYAVNIEFNGYRTDGVLTSSTLSDLKDELIENKIDSQINVGSVNKVSYHYGNSAVTDTCTSLLFNELGDFKYVEISINPEGVSCESLRQLATEINFVVSGTLNGYSKIIRTINE